MRRSWGAPTGIAAAAALLLTFAGAAHAGGIVFPMRGLTGKVTSFSGPVFAGEARVAWAIRRGTGSYLVTTSALDGTDRTSLQAWTPLIPHGSNGIYPLAASAERLVLGIDAQYCAPLCQKSQHATPRIAFRGYYGGPTDGPDILEQVEDACTAGGDYYDYDGVALPTVQVSGEAIAYRMCAGGARIRDYAPGATPAERDLPDALLARLAGSVVATSEPTAVVDDERIAVRDWRVGTELYEVTGARPRGYSFEDASFDVRSDGTLVTSLDDGVPAESAQLRRHTAADPEGEPVGGPLAALLVVRLVDDRIAHWTREPGAPTVGVRALTGEDIVAPRRIREAFRPLDFDGGRLLWATRPCARAAVVVWDLEGEPPGLPAGECPFARLVRPTGRIDRKRRVSVVVACPAKSPALGCPGALNGSSVWNVPRSTSFALDPGGQRRIRVRTHRSLCIDAQGRTRARLKILAQRRNKSNSRVRVRTLVVEGPKPSVPACAS